MSSLKLAQESRRQRGERLADAQLEHLLDAIGLSEAKIEEAVKLGTANVSPADRKRLKGIIDRLRTKPHPFTQCMRDLRKHHPEWSDDRRKRTCAVLKQLTGRGQGKTNASDEGTCVLLDDGLAALLEMVDMDALESVMADEKGGS